jgi:hypothetical protein
MGVISNLQRGIVDGSDESVPDESVSKRHGAWPFVNELAIQPAARFVGRASDATKSKRGRRTKIRADAVPETGDEVSAAAFASTDQLTSPIELSDAATSTSATFIE